MKDYVVYCILGGQRQTYNEEYDNFGRGSGHETTYYTEAEAKEKRDKLLAPSKKHYQETGNYYTEIYWGLKK